jgi:riboflavin kinase/FMN adenylyltransferase
MAPERPLAFLSDLDERQAILGSLGLDFAVIHPFTQETADTPAAVFVTSLKQSLQLEELWVGPDFTLGRRKEGDVARLQALGEKLEFTVRVVPHFCLEGRSVRSTRIRALMQEGNVSEAARMLGRPYSVWGHVLPGPGPASSTTIPRVSVALEPQRVLPCGGIYAGWADVAGQRGPAVIGISGPPAPECAGATRRVEVALPDLQGQPFGKPVTLTFVERLHAERPQQCAEESPEQAAPDVGRDVARDIARTRRLLNLD